MNNLWFLSDKYNFDSQIFTIFSSAAMALNLIKVNKRIDDQPEILELQTHLNEAKQILQDLLEFYQNQREESLTKGTKTIKYSNLAFKLIELSDGENPIDELEKKVKMALIALSQLENPDRKLLSQTISFFYKVTEAMKTEIEQESDLFNI